MGLVGIQHRELLPYGVELELDQMAIALNTAFEQEHNGHDGSHGDITVASITASSSNLNLPITGNIQILKGAWLIDNVGNSESVHVAGLRPGRWTASQHNYNPPGIAHAFVMEVETDADRSLTGIQRTARQKRFLLFFNRGNYNITLEHNDSNSFSGNRIACPNSTDLVVGSGEGVWLYYDVGSEIWRVMGIV